MTCVIINSIDNFNTSKVTDMGAMFMDCIGLTSLDLSNFDTSNVEKLSLFVKNCKALEAIDMSSFRTPKLTQFSNVFFNCSSLKEVDMSNFDFSSIERNYYDFENNYELHLIKLPVNYDFYGKSLEGAWYKLNDNKTVDRTQRYETMSVMVTEPLTVIREFTHSCSNVTNGKGTCSMCGATVVYGDNNDDGKLDVSDAVMLKKHLAGDTTTNINMGAANVNSDDKISVEDAVKLMQKLAGMDVKLGVAE